MANITKCVVSGRRPEFIAAAATATERLARESQMGTLVPPAPWPLSSDPRKADNREAAATFPSTSWRAIHLDAGRRVAADELANRRARFRRLLRPRTAGESAHPNSRSPLGPHGIQGLLGEVAWRHLPEAVRYRFSEPTRHVDYTGEFEIVRASLLGRAIAWISTLIGTPVVPRTGQSVSAIIHVGPGERGASWLREYQWPSGRVSRVHSTKVIGADGTLVEELPFGLRMPLEVLERHGVLHFVSLGYYFDTGLRFGARTLKIPLPHWLSPGTTHVEHADETDGWFRFTMTVTHPLLGELFYQTGRFRDAASDVAHRADDTLIFRPAAGDLS